MTEKLILHIEDTWECQQLVRAIVTYHGYRLISADTGEEGVAQAQAQHPDLILMDIHLPGIDGLEATDQIRRLPALASVPIIAVTAADEAIDFQRAVAAGCDAYLDKPFSPSRLIALIRQWCEPVQARV